MLTCHAANCASICMSAAAKCAFSFSICASSRCRRSTKSCQWALMVMLMQDGVREGHSLKPALLCTRSAWESRHIARLRTSRQYYLRPVWERLRAVGRGRLPGTLPQAGAACQPACGLRAVGRAPGQPPSAGLGRPPVVQGVREGVDVGATGKGALYFLCSSSIREYKNINSLFH